MDIEELRKLCSSGAIKWTAHVLARLQERGIAAGRIIDQYPEDYPYPSCLVLGATVAGKVLHTVVGIGGGYIWLITAYYPSPLKWNEDFSVRKERQE